MDWLTWYNGLAKPDWTPAPQTIGRIWSVLYPIILASLAFVVLQAVRGRLPWLVVLPFVINLVSNLVFTPIQFSLRNLPLASIDILVVLGTIVWSMLAVWPHYRPLAIAQLPYLAWVSTATILQLQITAMNWRR